MSKQSLTKNFTHIFGKANPPSEDFITATWDLLAQDGGRAMVPRLIRYMAERKANRERWVKPLVDAIVPIRLINGSEDPISGMHAADRFAEVVPQADIVHLSHAGHYPHVETPEAVLNAFFAFHGI
jgi:pimeloyl-ACP methyl ester carboxylesterase